MSCSDRWKEERDGHDAARFGERYDYDHRERMNNARFDSTSCDAYYARGYKREIERRNEEREEEGRREHREEQARAEARALADAEEDYYCQAQQYREYSGEADPTGPPPEEPTT